MSALVLATRNRHKLRELGQLIAPLGIQVCSISDLYPNAPEPVEDADTFEGNAQIKAAAAWHATGKASVADDSGICVAALAGAPGVHSARWAGPDCDDEANNAKLLAELGTREDRRAHYHCSLVLVCGHEYLAPSAPVRGLDSSAVWISFSGQLHGHITDRRAGTGGFGYDPYFHLEASQCTVAELSDEEKHVISHRGIAFRKLYEFLRDYRA